MALPLTIRSTAIRGALALMAGCLMALSMPPDAWADDTEPVAAVITRLRVQEAPQPIRERKQWRSPKKIVLLEFGNQTAWTGRQEKFAAVAPKAQVVVARDLPSALAAIGDADVIVGFNPEVCNRQIIENAKQLRWISSLAAGVEVCLAIPSVRGRDLLMTNMRGVDSAAIAEHAVAMTMALAHGLDTFAVDTSKGIWSPEHGATTPMQSLEGKTMLVVGLGGIGTEVAMKAHGLGMKIVATRDNDRGKPDFVSYVGLANEMLTLARTADVIVNCVPLTSQTRGIYNAAFFAALKPTAYFINVARGASAVTADLTTALNEHRLAGAGLDVVEPEPLPPDDPLWHAPHVIISPHISSRSDLPGEARWTLAVENLRRYTNGEKMLSVVDLSKGY